MTIIIFLASNSLYRFHFTFLTCWYSEIGFLKSLRFFLSSSNLQFLLKEVKYSSTSIHSNNNCRLHQSVSLRNALIKNLATERYAFTKIRPYLFKVSDVVVEPEANKQKRLIESYVKGREETRGRRRGKSDFPRNSIFIRQPFSPLLRRRR